MDTKSTLIREIEAFVADNGMKETTFGRLAVNDGKFVGRLRDGGEVQTRTVERVRSFIARPRIEHRASEQVATR